MNEPTKEAIEEALRFAERFFVMDFNTPSWVFTRVDLIDFIAAVRTEATNKMLEQAAGEFDRLER